MSACPIFSNDTGLDFRQRLRDCDTGGPFDASGFDTFVYEVTRPDGTAAMWTCATEVETLTAGNIDSLPPGGYTVLTYVTQPGDLSQVGEYRVQPALSSTGSGAVKRLVPFSIIVSPAGV